MSPGDASLPVTRAPPRGVGSRLRPSQPCTRIPATRGHPPGGDAVGPGSPLSGRINLRGCGFHSVAPRPRNRVPAAAYARSRSTASGAMRHCWWMPMTMSSRTMLSSSARPSPASPVASIHAWIWSRRAWHCGARRLGLGAGSMGTGCRRPARPVAVPRLPAPRRVARAGGTEESVENRCGLNLRSVAGGWGATRGRVNPFRAVGFHRRPRRNTAVPPRARAGNSHHPLLRHWPSAIDPTADDGRPR